jgi:hypothetical protein
LKRIPAISNILPVFAVISSLFYGWSMVIFLWKLPGWLFFLNAGEIAGIFAYQLITNLAESLLVLSLLLVVGAILPPPVFKDVFPVRGSLVALILISSMMLFLNRYVAIGSGFGASQSLWMLGTLLLIVPLAMLSTRVRVFNTAISWISDRLIIFLFLLLPLSALAILYVLATLLI